MQHLWPNVKKSVGNAVTAPCAISHIMNRKKRRRATGPLPPARAKGRQGVDSPPSSLWSRRKLQIDKLF